MTSCVHCGKAIPADNILCTSCGALRKSPDSDVACENHQGVDAIACCTMCGKPVCGDCSMMTEGVFVCDSTEHRSEAGRWVHAARAAGPFEADMVRTNLSQAGIRVLVSNPADHVVALRSGKSLSISLRVERSDLPKAVEMLRSLHLLDQD